jgi:Phytanoyl-CoA dioxygenase (PhyH)
MTNLNSAVSPRAPRPLAALCPDQIEEFHRQGFVVLDTPLIAPSEVGWCRKILLDLIDRGTGRENGRSFDLIARTGGDGRRSPQILSPSLYATELRRLSIREAAQGIAQQLLGPEASFAGDHSILKPAGDGGPTPWHQDEALRDPAYDYNEISMWIALNDSTLENGAMAYIPGSHLGDVLPHRLYGGSADANCIECYEGFDDRSAAVRPIRAGSLIIHHGRTIHGASGNTTDAPRLAYILSYTTPPTPRTQHREFPWLDNLRQRNRERRNKYLARGGFIPEMIRIARSDRYADRHFLAGFLRRRLKQIRKFLGIEPDQGSRR